MNERALPTWAEELVTLLPACAHFLLSGNVGDKYFVDGSYSASPDSDGPNRLLLPLADLIACVLHRHGIELVTSYDISDGLTTVAAADGSEKAVQELLGLKLSDVPPGSLPGLLRLIEAVATSDEPTALVIRSASRLVRDIAQLSDEEFRFYRSVDRLARDSLPSYIPGATRSIFSPIIWVLDNERDVPPWFALRNEFLRSVVIPLPHIGERTDLASRLVPTLAPGGGASSAEALAAGVRALTEQSAGMSLVAMERTIAVARDQGLGPDRVEDASRSYRVGVTENPWKAPHLRDRLRRELVALDSPGAGGEDGHPASILASRVLGQDAAVRKALDIIVRSSSGLTAAQAGPAASRPRGVLFFAGPTGVGKTELAKALTKLLFDDERFYVRFDMSEFSAEHAADRLIGAPPGYVGYDAGGELTNAVRQRPFSLVLFDEVEKADPRILDKFLQLLDDGRLTDGRGETVFFTEAVIVFTSNIGIYAEVEEVHPAGLRTSRRRPVEGLRGMGHPEMAAHVRKAVEDFFVLKIERPELLNRIGGDNIVVFDFIDRVTGSKIVDLMLANITARIGQEHGVHVSFDAATRRDIDEASLDDKTLELGGRGIGGKLETIVINPLANQLFLNPPAVGANVVARLDRLGERWTARLLPA